MWKWCELETARDLLQVHVRGLAQPCNTAPKKCKDPSWWKDTILVDEENYSCRRFLKFISTSTSENGWKGVNEFLIRSFCRRITLQRFSPAGAMDFNFHNIAAKFGVLLMVFMYMGGNMMLVKLKASPSTHDVQGLIVRKERKYHPSMGIIRFSEDVLCHITARDASHHHHHHMGFHLVQECHKTRN